MSDYSHQLIQEVAKHPLLFNKSLRDYRDSHKKESVWEQIGDLLESTGRPTYNI